MSRFLLVLLVVLFPAWGQTTEVCKEEAPTFPWVNHLRTGVGVGGQTITNQGWNVAFHGDITYQLPLVTSRCGKRSSSGIFTTTNHWSLGLGPTVSGTINAANLDASRNAFGLRVSIDNMVLGFPEELNPMLSLYAQAGPTFGLAGSGLGGRLGASAWLAGAGFQFERFGENANPTEVYGFFVDLTNLHTLFALWLAEG